MNKIAVSRKDGGVSIVIPSDEATEESMLKDALNCDGYSSHREIDDSQIPTFRDYRDAWMDNGKMIVHDMIKANKIKRNKLRDIRKPLLDQLDVDYMKADELGDLKQKSEIANKKQKLRDVTIFDDINDIDKLREYMPDVLKI